MKKIAMVLFLLTCIMKSNTKLKVMGVLDYLKKTMISNNENRKYN